MPTTTTTLRAFLGASGLTGGLVIYEADGTTTKLAHTTSGVSEIGSTKNYQKPGVTLDLDTEYVAIWDDGLGNTLPAQTVYLATGVNLVTINGRALQNGNGVAAAVGTNTIDLSTTDAYRAANLANWTVEILSATTGAGQVGTVATSGITSPFRQTLAANWGTTPTGPVEYALHPPVPTSGGGGDTPGTTTLLARIPGTIPANGSGFTALGDSRLGNLDAAVSSRLAPGGTLATVTNLTNAATNGDFTTTQKTSLNASTPSVTVDTSGIANATVTAWWAKTSMLGDGTKTAQQTLTKAMGRLIGREDNTTVVNTAIFMKADNSGEAYRQTYNTAGRGNHAPGSGL